MNKVIQGKATVIRSRRDYPKIKSETILISKETHPDLVLVIRNIKGIVVEVDNRLCHAAIVAREFGIPILMGVKEAAKRFKTGDRVAVDFERKTIRKMK